MKCTFLGLQSYVSLGSSLRFFFQIISSLFLTPWSSRTEGYRIFIIILSFVEKGVERTRPASNGLNPAQVPFSLTNNQTVLRVKISRHRGAKEGGQLRLHTCTLLACYP